MLARLPASLGQRAHLRLAKSTPGWITPSLCKPERRTAGPGLSSPPTPSYGLPAVGSLIFRCPGSDPRSRTTHPNARGGVSPTSCNDRHSGQPTEAFTGRARTAQGDSTTTEDRYPSARERHEVVVRVQRQAQRSCRAWWPPKSICSSDGYLARCSINIRTARSPISGEYRVPWHCSILPRIGTSTIPDHPPAGRGNLPIDRRRHP